VSYFLRKYDVKNILLLVLFGSILPLSMAPFHFWPAGIISVGVFSFLISGDLNTNPSFKLIFFRSFSYGVGLYSVGASWIFVSIHRYGQASVELSLLLIILFILFLSFLFSLPFALCTKLAHTNKKNVVVNTPYFWTFTSLIVFPSLWVLGEWFRGWIFSGFPWLYLGYAHTDTWLSGWGPVGGVLGLSWIVAFCSAILGLLLQLRSQIITTKFYNQKIFIPIVSSLNLVIFFWLGGLYLQKIEWTQPTNKSISIGLIQPAISLWRSWDPNQLSTILAQYRKDTKNLLKNDLVVWPEAAIPRFQNEVADYLGSIKKEAKETNTALIVGLPTKFKSDSSSNKKNRQQYYNSALVLGYGSGIYHKQRLVPFGEYVPLERWLRGAIRFFDLPMSAFSSGPKNQKNIIIKNNIRIGTSICYEIAYSELVRRSAKNSSLLLTISNDAWFGESIGPKQHFQIARMRAIENGKPLIRATNNGVSALIDANGKVTATIPSFYRDTLEGELEPRNGTTPFGKLGSYPIIFLSFLLVSIGLLKECLIKKSSA